MHRPAPSRARTRPLPRTLARFGVLAGAAVALPAGAAAQTSGTRSAAGDGGEAPALEALRLEGDTSIDLDGRLDEESWGRAQLVSDFRQQEPVEGGEPSRRTEVRVVYDRDYLYLGAVLLDDPDGILAYQRRRDAGLGTDDRFMWILDTFLDGRTGYFFEINPAGLMGDGLITGGGGFPINKSWDGIWEARTERLPHGWSAEIRIPFQTLNFDPASEAWGINFQRTIRRRNEEILWRGHRRNQGLFRPIHAGRLVGLEDLSQGVGVEATASAVTGWRTDFESGEPTAVPGDLSFDLTYSLTASLKASASVNTDFAEVEVDDRRVNLTRFPLRFQERRDFFLEGSGVFSFAPRSGPSPYFSRRIGLEDGEQVPVDLGLRLGGQQGAYELGFLHVETGGASRLDDGASHRVPSERFTVARVRRQILSQSTVGAIYTRRATGGGGSDPGPEDRHTAGVDVNLATSSFLGDANAELEAFAVWNSDPDPVGDAGLGDLTARGFRLNFPNDIWSGHLSYREFGSRYDPAVGFVTRNGFRRIEPRVGWSPRPASIPWLRQLEFDVLYRYLEGFDSGVKEEEVWQFGLLGMNFESGDNLDVGLSRTFEYLTDGFEVSDGIGVPAGGYTVWETSVSARTTGRRRVSGRAELARGGFWDGERTRLEGGLDFRPGPGLSFGMNWERNDVTLPRGDFTTSLYRVEGAWDASPWVSFNGNVQLDDQSDVLGLFLKARWIVRPGNDVFFVYTENWRNFDAVDDPLRRGFSTISRGGSLKVNYTYRF